MMRAIGIDTLCAQTHRGDKQKARCKLSFFCETCNNIAHIIIFDQTNISQP